jgi:uncharacterized RDD family membrane protein YckC
LPNARAHLSLAYARAIHYLDPVHLQPAILRFRHALLPLIALSAWLSAVAALGQTLPAASDAEHLWVILKDRKQDALTIYHRAQSDEPDRLTEVDQLHGQLMPGAIAAADGKLWLIYEDQSVQSIAVSPAARRSQGWVYASTTHAALPAAAILRASAAQPQTLWVLVRVEDRAALQALDAPTPTAAATEPAHDVLNITLGLPAGVPLRATQPAETQPQTQPATAPDTTTEHPQPIMPVDRLLHLSKDRWQLLPLPADWPQMAPAWLLAPSADQLLLLTAPPDEPAGTLWVYQLNPQGWSRETYNLKNLNKALPLIVQGQLLLAAHQPNHDALDVALAVLRLGHVHPIGTLSIPAAANHAWKVVPTGTTAALLARVPADAKPAPTEKPSLNLWWTRMDLRGQTLLQPTPLQPQPEHHWSRSANSVLLMAVLVLAMLMVFIFWRRDPAQHRLQLPADFAVADLFRRAFAGAIDLLPGFLIIMKLYNLNIQDLIRLHWPGREGPLQAVIPGALVITIFLLHTIVTELLTTRTLGKWLTGLRVTTLQGARPRPWQILVRGLLKGFDLLAQVLLILPLLSPYRQRLGDIVARTVVVMRIQPQPENHP